jgi:DNA-binding transcriptional MerR regulator
MSETRLTIGALSSSTNTSVPTIRYYEEIGLLPRAQRAANGHRNYRDADLKRLSFIKRCRGFGFPIEQVRELVALFADGDRACVEARDMAQMHLDSVRAKQHELKQLEANLLAFVESCDEACCKGVTRNCAIIEELSAIKPSLSITATANAPASGCCSGAASQINEPLNRPKPLVSRLK